MLKTQLHKKSSTTDVSKIVSNLIWGQILHLEEVDMTGYPCAAVKENIN